MIALAMLSQPVMSQDAKTTHTLTVTATGYNSVPEQTDSSPDHGAWGDKLSTKNPSIAVSRDLLTKYGLERGDVVTIVGFGKFKVLDKMNRRWEKKIDRFFGKDVDAAITWGKKTVVITWTK